MRTVLTLLTIVFSVIAGGCATSKQLITTPLPVLHLRQAEDRATTGIHYAQWHIPPGDFVAAFRDDAGVYYQPPTPVILYGTPAAVYIFIGKDGRQGIFVQGGILVMYFEQKLDFSTR